jgi:2,3-bisphosphoglycerate-dependent phosphoglycerate mutase
LRGHDGWVGGWAVFLVRHAVPFSPVVGGPDDLRRGLTGVGFRQAEDLAGELPEPDLVVSSPYLRAVQTVEPLARSYGLTVQVRYELREWDSGLEVTPDFARHYARSWDEPSGARPGGESLDQLSIRATDAVRRLTPPAGGGIVVIGSHGTFIARALSGFGVAGIDWPFAATMPMPAVYRLSITGSGVIADGPGL